MATEKVDARDWVTSINTGSIAVPVWTAIGGIDEFGLAKSATKTDTGDFDSNGKSEHNVMERGGSIALKGFFLEDLATKARDAGQAAVETLAEAVGSASLGQFKFVSPAATGKIAMASVELDDVGGGKNAKTSWGCTLEFSGAVTVAP